MVTIDTADAEQLRSGGRAAGRRVTETMRWYVVRRSGAARCCRSRRWTTRRPGRTVHLDLWPRTSTVRSSALAVGASRSAGDDGFRGSPWPTRRQQFCVAAHGTRSTPLEASRAGRSIASPKTSVWRSTSASVWCGLNSAMLWNGVSRTPRLRHHRCRNPSRSSSTAAAAAAPSRGGGQNQYSARQPRRCTCQGRPCSAITPATPSVNRSASGTATAKSSSRRQVDRVARIAARARALPVRVPPTPATSISWPSIGPSRRSATSAVMPYAARGDAAADRLADHDEVGLEAPGGGAAAGPGAQRVRLVDDQQHAVPAGDLADRVEVAVARAARCRCWSARAPSAGRRRRPRRAAGRGRRRR